SPQKPLAGFSPTGRKTHSKHEWLARKNKSHTVYLTVYGFPIHPSSDGYPPQDRMAIPLNRGAPEGYSYQVVFSYFYFSGSCIQIMLSVFSLVFHTLTLFHFPLR